MQEASFCDYLVHAIAFGWKLLFALVPPPSMLGGWLTFVVALSLIGVLTAVVGDFATIFGCLVGLEDSVTAITLVAIGTSLPDLFASRLAALHERSADNSIGNVTGSNSVNVFLGLGLSWLAAAIYWRRQGDQFKVNAGSLCFSVIIYTVVSVLCILLLFLRRHFAVFGKAELGGPRGAKYACSALLVVLWFIYILFSTLQAYELIPSL